MHEASLMRGLMAKMEEIAGTEDARIVRVSVWLGALSHMSAEHFEASAAGTRAEGAELSVTVSTDISDPHAQDILLESVELEE